MGSSPATQPTPNKGYEMAGLQRIGVLLRGMEEALPMLGSGSEAGKDLLKAITLLSKHIPPGSVTPAAQKNTIESMAMKSAQQGAQAAQMRQPPAAAAA